MTVGNNRSHHNCFMPSTDLGVCVETIGTMLDAEEQLTAATQRISTTKIFHKQKLSNTAGIILSY